MPNKPSHLDAADINSKQSKSWRDQIKVHPAADLFPMMTADELKALGEDIRKNGLQQQIVLWTPDSNYRKWSKPHGMRKPKRGEFYLLDARNRVDALVSLGWISFDENDGWPDISGYMLKLDADQPIIFGPEVDPYHYVLSANVHRRHLTPEQKRDLIAKLLKAQPEKSNRQLAKMVGVSHPHLAKVRHELETSGDVETVTTSIDTKGRKQPARKPAKEKRRDIADDEPAQAEGTFPAADRAETLISLGVDAGRAVQFREMCNDFSRLIVDQAERLSGDERTLFLVSLLACVERLLDAPGGAGAEPVGDEVAP